MYRDKSREVQVLNVGKVEKRLKIFALNVNLAW